MGGGGDRGDPTGTYCKGYFEYMNHYCDEMMVDDDMAVENRELGRLGRIRSDEFIHPSAIIGKQPTSAKNSATTTQGKHNHPLIGPGTKIGAFAIIYAGAVIGENCYIADGATVREGVKIGDGTIVGRGVAVENDCWIGKNVKIETNAYITAFSELRDNVFIAPNVTTSNDNYCGRDPERKKHYKGVTALCGARVGAGATILPGIIIGEECLVAAGSVVTKNTGPREIVAGVPAKFMRMVPQEQWLENQ